MLKTLLPEFSKGRSWLGPLVTQRDTPNQKQIFFTLNLHVAFSIYSGCLLGLLAVYWLLPGNGVRLSHFSTHAHKLYLDGDMIKEPTLRLKLACKKKILITREGQGVAGLVGLLS